MFFNDVKNRPPPSHSWNVGKVCGGGGNNIEYHHAERKRNAGRAGWSQNNAGRAADGMGEPIVPRHIPETQVKNRFKFFDSGKENFQFTLERKWEETFFMKFIGSKI